MKERILVCLESALYFRNFILSEAFNELEKTYEVGFALPFADDNKEVRGVKEDLIKLGKKNVFEFSFSRHRAMELFALAELSMVKLRHKSKSFILKYEKQHLTKPRRFYRLRAIPGIFEVFQCLHLRKQGLNESLEEVLTKFQPGLILLPTSLVDPLSIDVIQSAKKRKIKTLMLINGWDNLSSKGTIPQKPDFMGVWGDQSIRHATQIHGMHLQKVVPLGVPHFRKYYLNNEKSRETFLNKLGIDPQKRVVLFAGSSRPFDETEILLEIEKSCDDGRLPADLHFIYRPHPWRHRREHEESFYKYTFKHITIDPQLSPYYKASKEKEHADPKPNDILPDLDYYPTLLGSVCAVIQPCSTMLVESAIMGRPSLVIAFGDGKHSFAPDTMIQFEHFQDVLNMEGVVVCRDKAKFIEQTREIIEMGTQGALAKSLKEDIKRIAYHDGRTYSQTLNDFVKNQVLHHS